MTDDDIPPLVLDANTYGRRNKKDEGTWRNTKMWKWDGIKMYTKIQQLSAKQKESTFNFIETNWR